MFTARNARLQRLAEQAGIELTNDIEFFGELVAEECADIADSATAVDLPAAPVIRRHFSLPEPKK
jgi:hypothetical protein